MQSIKSLGLLDLGKLRSVALPGRRNPAGGSPTCWGEGLHRDKSGGAPPQDHARWF